MPINSAVKSMRKEETLPASRAHLSKIYSERIAKKLPQFIVLVHTDHK